MVGGDRAFVGRGGKSVNGLASIPDSVYAVAGRRPMDLTGAASRGHAGCYLRSPSSRSRPSAASAPRGTLSRRQFPRNARNSPPRRWTSAGSASEPPRKRSRDSGIPLRKAGGSYSQASKDRTRTPLPTPGRFRRGCMLRDPLARYVHSARTIRAQPKASALLTAARGRQRLARQSQLVGGWGRRQDGGC